MASTAKLCESTARDAMDSSGAPERHQSAKASDALGSTRKEESVGKHTTIAMDIAKNVFEVAVSTEPGRVKERRRLTKSQMLRFFANREPARVVSRRAARLTRWRGSSRGTGTRWSCCRRGR